MNEWLAANTVDFFNEISLLYGLVADDAQRFKEPGSGFPPGFEYRWMDEVKHKPVRCSSPEYVDYVMTWVEDQLAREDVFPVEEAHPFPEDFRVHVKDIFKRRCFSMRFVVCLINGSLSFARTLSRICDYLSQALWACGKARGCCPPEHLLQALYVLCFPVSADR